MNQKNKRFNLCEYLYYRTTVLYSKIEKKAGFADNKNTGAWVVGTCFTLNVITVWICLLLMFFDDYKAELKIHSYVDVLFVGTGVFVYGFCWFYFTKKHHDAIFNKYEQESEPQKKKRGRRIIVYIILSFLLPIALVIYNSK